MWKKYLKELSLPESYISITLGFLVVIVGGLLLYNYLNKGKLPQPPTRENTMQEVKGQPVSLPASHTISEGETIWSIAEKYYTSGYNWVTLAKENNLSNPDYVQAGSVLSIPKAEPIKPEGEISAAAVAPPKEYTFVEGDNLWNIAVKEYSDGYAWVRIARENNLVNPDLIHTGNILKLPR